MVVYFNCTGVMSTEFRQLLFERSVTAMILRFFVFLTSMACTLEDTSTTHLFDLTISTSVYLAVLSGHIKYYFNFKSPYMMHCAKQWAFWISILEVYNL